MKQSENASKVVWDWRAEEEEDFSLTTKKNQTTGIIQGVVGLTIGTLFYLFLSKTLATVIFVIAGFVLLAALFSPGFLLVKIKGFIDMVSRWVGTFMTWFLLFPMYHLFFTPFRFLFRSGKKDTMTRWLDKNATTYWNVVEGVEQEQRYERQD